MTTTTTLLDNLEIINDALESGAQEDIDNLLEKLHPAEIAQILESLPSKQREIVWESEKVVEADVLPYVGDTVRQELMHTMDASEVAAATEGMDTDDAVDLLQDLSDEVIEEVLQAVNEQQRRRLTQVLFYPEDSAGGLMNTDTLTVRLDLTLKIVLRYLRGRQALPEKTDALMVVDRYNHYLGILPLSELIINEPEMKVRDVMWHDVEGISAHLSTHEVAHLFERRDLISAPVVDEEGFLLGRITVDDVIDVIRQESEHALMSRAGLDEAEDMFAPILSTTRQRAIWLGINLATAFLAAWVIGLFEATLEKVVAVAVLMPIVASMGGIAGTQTLTVVIRGIALGKISSANIPWLLQKEILVGVFNGIIWAVVVAVLAVLWFKNLNLGFIIACALLINLFFAALSGMLIPLVLKRLSIDPALAGGVILTTVTDVVGFFAFLGLATIFLVNA